LDEFEKTKRQFLQPIFFEAGAGLYDCQAFENCVAYMLYLLSKLGVMGLDPADTAAILDHEAKKTAGQLVAALRKHTTLSEGIEDALANALAAIRAGMDEHAILVFRDQAFSDAEQLEFGQRLDGRLHQGTGSRAFTKSRLGNEAISDISNLDPEGEIMKADDRRRHYTLGNRLWHTDASFVDPPGRYSMLHARFVPPVPADTEFADMRAAYDALPAEMKSRIADLLVHHSIAHSRQTLGFEFSQNEQEALKGAIHPLIRTIPRSLRRSLYVASHASRIIDWPVSVMLNEGA
jgi:alpha-ketoglutarate-dependent taurine dioxygenase